MSTAGKATLVVLLAPVLVVCGLGVVVIAAWESANASCATSSGGGGRWDAEQTANADTIVRAGADLGVPRRGWVIAVATAMQESSLRNLGHLGERNDHDSLGLFQQRPSQGWGTPAQLTDPVYAAAAFYRTLLTVAGWEQLPMSDAAQRVQRSAFPQAYAKWENAATAMVADAAARLGLPEGCVSGGWVVPVPAGRYTLTSGYGPRWGTFHYGLDFAAPAGTPILAATAGTVVGAACTSPFCDRPGVVSATGMPLTQGCGWRVQIQTIGDVATTYCHAQTLTVHTGQTVRAGEVIGFVGSTGNSTGNHLHFQVHVHAPPISNATTVDPAAYLRALGIAV
jgi:murein DD-endopeptidase MepM/ murein hydrolase activator NlpD